MFSGDTTLLKQMVGNLLDNAIRHAQPGGIVTATVSHDSTDDQRSALPTMVRGSLPENQARVFERFVRFDSRSQGAGLGLPIARWIAEAHGGTLVLESTGPSGTCFAVTLPAS